jgi:glutaconate CoA-transferase subunit B
MDMYGNINTTVIGNHALAKVRLPGSGGCNDVASFSQRLIIIIANQSKRVFVNRLDFITTLGYLDGPGDRERIGLPEGTGPYRVITQQMTPALRFRVIHEKNYTFIRQKCGGLSMGMSFFNI